MKKRPKIHCPICRKEVAWEGNPFRPFCSERCKLLDLGEWISEGYRIRTTEQPPAAGAPPEETESD